MRFTIPTLLAAATLAACATDEIPPEVQEAVAAANDALAVAAISAEAAGNVGESSYREAGPCPAITKDGTMSDFTVTADYGEGCVPDSGLVLAEMGGAITVDYADQTLSLIFDAFRVDGASVDGSITGTYDEASLQGITLGLQCQLAFGGDVTGSAQQALAAQIGWNAATLDGSSTVELDGVSYDTSMDGVELDYDAMLASSCPIPSAGTIRVQVERQWAEVLFDASSPQDGTADVTYMGRVYEDVPVCTWASALL